MSLYTRRQIFVLLILLAVAGLGLAVGHWRRARPDLVDYLEQLDRVPAPSPSPASQADRNIPDAQYSPAPEMPRPRHGKLPRSSANPRDSPPDATSPAVDGGSAIDLNRATALDLTRLPGIGPALARRIVDTRDAGGRFGRVEELARVRGISRRKLEQLRGFVKIAE